MQNFITSELDRRLSKILLPFDEVSKDLIKKVHNNILKDLQKPESGFIICGMGTCDNASEGAILEYVKVTKVVGSFEEMRWNDIIKATGKDIIWKHGPVILLQIENTL